MKPLQHVMILASAGSGKTFALTNRFIDLLARGAAPERIVALTFTRKAAGEFFDEILHKLAGAAADPGAAARLARDIDAPQLREADFRRMLRQVVDAMHRLRLGTLDSFFARIARVFPFELGLTGEFEVLEEHAARLERQRVLQRMFTQNGDLVAAQQGFIEAFKRATFGAEEKQLGPKLDAFLDAHQERYLDARDAVGWGEPARIWPGGTPWLAPAPDRISAGRTLAAWVASAPIGPKQQERWRMFLLALESWSPGMVPTRELAYGLEKALAAWPALLAGRAVLEFDRKKQELDAAACAALAELTRHVIGGELLRRIETTRGIHAVLDSYDAVYHAAVRRAGKLTFGDVQRLLLPDGGIGALTRQAGDDERLFIDYRLDAEIDHWLLDEFQDTSFGQWSILRNLIDEVVQDASGTRSFFCVGDVKQAIFTWREGDPRLFREIFHHYNRARPGTIMDRHLVDSWRSGPSLIEMVNAVFGAAKAIEELFPGPAAEAWNKEWRAHVSAVPERDGQCALILAADENERWARLVQILQEIRPLERGLTCAVLVPKNSTATALADYLRREGGFPAVADSDLHVCTDNPLGAALLALVQAAAHPGDTLAWEHVQMTPLRHVLNAEGITTPEEATWRILREVHAVGFERMVESWLRKVEVHLAPDDAFSRLRARQLAAAAARYDQTGSRNIAEFVQFMDRHVVRDAESGAVIRVMTIHKSKGLGFDVVLLPDLQGNRIDERRGGLAVQKASDRTVEWILDLPPKLFYAADEVLARHVAEAEAEACYEALSLLYVGFTRAKRAMYVLVEPVGKSTSRNYPRLLADTLGRDAGDVRIGGLTVSGVWSRGNPDWHARAKPPELAALKPAIGLSAIRFEAANRVVRREARRPSGEGGGNMSAVQLFSLDRGMAVEHGAALHALLAEVEWGDRRWAEAWLARGAPRYSVDEAAQCLDEPALASLWTRLPRAEVWRERAFEIVLDGTWVSGVFDRVIVERDDRGAVEWVTVIDFKTDRVMNEPALAAAAQRHAAQLNLYRRVAAALTRVPLQMVTCELVFTYLRRRVRIPAE